MSGDNEYQDLLQGAVSEGNGEMPPVAPVKKDRPAATSSKPVKPAKPVKERRWSIIVNDMELYRAMRNYVDDLKDQGEQTDRTKEILNMVRKGLEEKGYLEKEK